MCSYIFLLYHCYRVGGPSNALAVREKPAILLRTCGDFQKLGVPFLGVPIIRTIVY